MLTACDDMVTDLVPGAQEFDCSNDLIAYFDDLDIIPVRHPATERSKSGIQGMSTEGIMSRCPNAGEQSE